MRTEIGQLAMGGPKLGGADKAEGGDGCADESPALTAILQGAVCCLLLNFQQSLLHRLVYPDLFSAVERARRAGPDLASAPTRQRLCASRRCGESNTNATMTEPR